jgi:DNA polymerase (family X)
MDKDQVANILDEIGTLLEIQGENRFRSQAYHNAARAVEQMEEGLAEVVEAGRLRAIPGIGETLQEAIRTLVTTGSLPFHEKLKSTTPPGLFQMLRLPGMGPKKVKTLFAELGIQDLAALKAACEEGRVAALKGFGAKTQQKILEGIEFLGQSGDRVRIDQAEALATLVLEGLHDCPGIIRAEVCGSLRRRKETINDIDILMSSDAPGPIMERFVTLPGVSQVLGHGATKSSVVLNRCLDNGRRLAIQADLRIVSDEQFPFALHYFTGGKEHNIAMRARAQQYGLKLSEYELAGPERRVQCKTEADLFRALDLDYIPPELREHTGEIDAAAQQRLPQLVELGDLRGVFHCHSTWSDGHGTVEEMALAARELGFTYLGFGDHSQSLTIARGLTPQRVREQQAEIDALQQRLDGIHLFKGIECDILADGSLDFDDEVLATFDYVVASVHSYFNQSEAEMTARIIRAISHPRVTMLGHATGRLLLRRDSYKLDIEAVLQAAAKHGTLVEINAHPQRLDLDWVHCKRARALGVQMVINPDAHNTNDLAYVRYGMDVARRAWLQKEDVFNTKTTPQVRKAFTLRRST